MRLLSIVLLSGLLGCATTPDVIYTDDPVFDFVDVDYVPSVEEVAYIFAGQKFCPQCKKEGLTSSIHASGWTGCTLMYCGGEWWDDEGNPHYPEPCNTCSQGYSCSQGHEWSESWASL